MRSLCRATSIVTVAVLGAGLGLVGCSEDIPAGQLGSSAEELTATTTFQSGVNGVVDDTFISASDMRANVGNDKRLRISAHNEGLIRFDLSSIPANAVINKAELTLYVNGGEDERDDDCRDGDHEGNSIAPLKVHRVTAAWAEGTVTYKSFDQAFDPAVAATMTLSSRHTYKTVDLKPLVQSWVSGSKPNYGVAITTAGRAHTLIASSEQNPVSQRPALKITYTTPDDHCSPNRCQHGGTCNNDSNGYTCTCPAGYAGRDCQIDVNECAGNPCRHGGQCTDQVNGYTCTCGDGWGGANCESDIDECEADPCQNGGVCTEVEQQSCGGHGPRHRGHTSGSHHGHHGHHDDDDDDDDADYTCACPPGFSGANCEVDIDDCAGNPCGANGTCADGANGYTCTCAAGYDGDTCQTNVDDCAASACQNGGTCVDGVGTYTCSCPPGFTGTHCETNVDDCAANSCLNAGTCHDAVDGYTCSCPAGITGTHCEVDIDECAGNPCGANGACNDLLDAYSCTCAAGYTGTHCETDVDECAGSPCQNGGGCVDGVNSYTCVCAAGFQGLTCADDIDECAANPCVHGTCNDQIAGYTCACQAGYGGANCDIDIDDCANVTCSGHGTCTDGVDSHTCVCDGFYTGADCQIAPCGNGLVQGAEQCDDGNTVNGDGCSSTCTLEGCPAGTVDPPASTVVADAGDRTAPAGYEYRGLAGQATAAATAECPDWSCGVGQGAAAGAIDDSRATMWNNGYWDVGAPIKLTITFLAPKTFYGLHIIAEAAPQDDETYSVIATKSDGSHVTIGPRTATIVDWRTVPAPTYTGADVGFGGTYSDITSIEITVTAPYVDPSVSSWIGIREVQLIQPAGCVSVCPAGGTFAAGKCYKFVAALASQPDALAACRLLPGGDLASAHSTEENRFLGTIIDPNGDGNGVGGLTAWIGGISPHGFNCPAEAQHGAAGIFNWTDGSAWNYNAWRTVTNEPDACPGVPVCTQLFPDNNFFHNNICGFGQTANGQSGCSGWNDVPCSLAMGYICQFNPN